MSFTDILCVILPSSLLLLLCCSPSPNKALSSVPPSALCDPSFAFLASVVSPGCIFISDNLELGSTDEQDITFAFVYKYAYILK